ncbi:L-proline dehydrogenase /delta-1-pyrroline-5-carboxylate dehydrogenase [Thiogranum longum]|uniref:Bifunctional protein PutA n=1 Tax=Thiogranum longum TaxID=1537524 RepID=A0A4R1HG01_9GAMM|nr:bifunctional proline dehydrogenase/L-glutamate gamma-semialdehyde dehydrogenase PutA [Thiogranum longum]TCK19180.1 L-proline dehydrogenase /delta-1-pyrroline-5-carboxylate dehydrogenase [Thiogranum longum]
MSASVHPYSDDVMRSAIRAANTGDEHLYLEQYLAEARLDPDSVRRIQAGARKLAVAARQKVQQSTGVDAFMGEYDLSSEEGVLLMCLAEALLRIPDDETSERLIADRLARGQWDVHLGASSSLLVNASTWGLLLTGQMLSPDILKSGAENLLLKMVARIGEPLARVVIQQAMRLLAGQFVMGRNMREALQRTDDYPSATLFSFDCLGEAALSLGDVTGYMESYQDAIQQLGRVVEDSLPLNRQPGISIKLSALHPRYEFAQRERVLKELLPRLKLLAEHAACVGIGMTIDAEEADRLELSLDLFERLVTDVPHHWQGLGLAVQAYQKRAFPVLKWLSALAQQQGCRIPVRLVKGAYWDSEIKRAQQTGLPGYPVFTRKAATDVSYLACARLLLQLPECFYPQFATHNALTLAWIAEIAAGREYELQRLHGMGDALYALLQSDNEAPPVRVYAPVGSYESLLPYLVRRLLENGANSSFVNALTDPECSIDSLIQDPCERIQKVDASPHPQIPLPVDLYGPERRNSRGLDLSAPDVVESLLEQVAVAGNECWCAAASAGGDIVEGSPRALFSPADPDDQTGEVHEADATIAGKALELAAAVAPEWDAQGGVARAACLLRAADLIEAQMPVLMAMVVREGGRTLPDALSEVREAIDFCRYYAHCASEEFEHPIVLPGPTGEQNTLELHGRGVFACISPWNFPLAIFTGQIAAALAAGNAVLAKPARQTALVAGRVVALLHEAGVPRDVLSFLPGSGAEIGRILMADSRLAGVAFTGSTGTARTLQQQLAERGGAIIPLIAETGGQNVMIADSSALIEQLVRDVIQSAFNSAGQRCSALRVLFLQDAIAGRTEQMLSSAMDELRIGDPMHLSTDIGPLIDRSALKGLEPHIARMNKEALRLKRIDPPRNLPGSFSALHVYRIRELAQLDQEVFGPVLHVIHFSANRLDNVIEAVNATGYGLTLGVHSRIESTWARVCERARVGNLYINRNMIGAVVGSQPFGGEGLSGTGPKAGGPRYLHRFATERTRSVNISAMGGNSGLLNLSDE